MQKCLDQADLLPVPLGQGAHGPREIGVEALGERIGFGAGPPPAQGREIHEDLAAGQPLVEAQVAGHDPEPGAKLHAVTAGIEPEHAHAARGRAHEVEHQTYRGRLSGPVRAQVAEHLALRNGEREVDHAAVCTVVLGQPIGDDDVHSSQYLVA